jgi:hypothetical protein
MYNCYVVGSIFLGGWLMLDPAKTWINYANPLCAYLNSVNPDYNGVLVDVLSQADMSQLVPGSHIYVGYGLDADEMMTAGRYNTYNVS